MTSARFVRRIASTALLILVVGAGRADAASFEGTGGRDVIFGTNVADDISGNADIDTLFGKAGDDNVRGDPGYDDIFLGGGGDIAVGAVGVEHIVDDDGGVTAAEADFIRGGAGGDFIYSADNEADEIDCGRGIDFAFVDGSDVTVDCENRFKGKKRTFLGSKLFFGSPKDDELSGTDHDDIFFGKNGRDLVAARSGSDLVFGGSGADRLFGGPDRDFLYDDDSREGDVLSGGRGNDILYSADGAADTVDCGDGDDDAYVDKTDTVTGCEEVFRNNS